MAKKKKFEINTTIAIVLVAIVAVFVIAFATQGGTTGKFVAPKPSLNCKVIDAAGKTGNDACTSAGYTACSFVQNENKVAYYSGTAGFGCNVPSIQMEEYQYPILNCDISPPGSEPCKVITVGTEPFYGDFNAITITRKALCCR